MLVMEAIVRRQDQEHCASITSMIRHYLARRAQVTEGHPHNVYERMSTRSHVNSEHTEKVYPERARGGVPRGLL
jgi:hypothetical protein